MKFFKMKTHYDEMCSEKEWKGKASGAAKLLGSLVGNAALGAAHIGLEIVKETAKKNKDDPRLPHDARENSSQLYEKIKDKKVIIRKSTEEDNFD